LKGFVGIIALIAVLLACSVLLLPSNSFAPTKNDLILETKIIMSNSEILMKQSAAQCDWGLANEEIEACINSKASDLASQINSIQNRVECTFSNFSKSASTAEAKITCITAETARLSLNAQYLITVSPQ